MTPCSGPCWAGSSRMTPRPRRWLARARSTGWNMRRRMPPRAITRSGMTWPRSRPVFVDLFLDACRVKPPREIVLDLDATDDPIHGHQEGRFFHGYYDCYCYLPLYIFCGRHLLAAKLRRSNIDASAGAVEEVQRIVGQIRARWPRVK